MRGLGGKIGVVAGGGRGIGAATAKRLAAEGAMVVVGDINEGWAKDCAHAIGQEGGKAVGLYLDGTSAESQAAIVQAAVDEFGGLDFFHSNLAGGTEGDVDALNCPADVFDRSVSINLKSHLLRRKPPCPSC